MRARRIVRAAIVLVLAGVLTIVGWDFCQLGRKAPARAPAGSKQQEGNRRTPEGASAIDFNNALSRAHLALHISYPNVADRTRAR